MNEIDIDKQIENLWSIYQRIKSLDLLSQKAENLCPTDLRDQLLLEVERLQSSNTRAWKTAPGGEGGNALNKAVATGSEPKYRGFGV